MNRFSLSGVSPEGTPARSGPEVSQGRYIRWLLERLAHLEKSHQRELEKAGPVTELFLAVQNKEKTEFYDALIEFGDLEQPGHFVVFLPDLRLGAPPLIFPERLTMCLAGLNDARSKLVTAPFGNPGCELLADPVGTILYYRDLPSQSILTSHWQTDVRFRLKLLEAAKEGWKRF